MSLPNVSIVVIGLNEEKNLHDTFLAIQKMNYPNDKIELIYVDSGSKDKSVEIAKRYTNKVFIEKNNWPSAARGRNRGLIESKNKIIHFIDGDVKIDKDYTRKAAEKIQSQNIDAVFGYLEEKSKHGINAILLTHWKNRKEGYHTATGGGGTYKRDALLSIDGYDERISRGEETDLGERFLNAAYKIWFMNEPMGIHDYGVNKFMDLIKIYFLDGINKSHLHLTNGKTKFYKSSKEGSINNLFFVTVFFFILITTIYFFGAWGLFYSFILYYLYFVVKYFIIEKVKNYNEFQYFFMMYSMKIVTFFGQMMFYLKCLINRKFYKSVINTKEKLDR